RAHAARDDHGRRHEGRDGRPHRHPRLRGAGRLPATPAVARPARGTEARRRPLAAPRGTPDHRSHAVGAGDRRGVAPRAGAAAGDRRKGSAPMSAIEKALVNLSSILVGLSGVAYAWMKYLMTTDDPYAVVNQPMQPWVLDLHLLAAPLLVFGV